MAGNYSYDTSWRPDPIYGGFLAAQREQEDSIARLMQMYASAQNMYGKQMENQLTNASIPAKTSEYALNKLMVDTAASTPDYANTIVAGRMNEVREKEQDLLTKKQTYDEKTKDIKEEDALSGLGNAISILEASPQHPGSMAIALDALERLNFPKEELVGILKEAGAKGIPASEILKQFKENYITSKARTPKVVGQQLIQTAKDASAMERTKAIIEGRQNVANIMAEAKKIAAANNTSGEKNQTPLQAAVSLIKKLNPDPSTQLQLVEELIDYEHNQKRYEKEGMTIGTTPTGERTIVPSTPPKPLNISRQQQPAPYPPIEDRSLPQVKPNPPGIQKAVEKLGKKFEPDKYDYYILPNGDVKQVPKNNGK